MEAQKEHVESIRDARHAYRIEVGGTMDGTNTRDPVGYGPFKTGWENNVSVRMENTGGEAVVNPWIVVGGRRNWRSIEDILAEVIDDDMADREKAAAIWDFARKRRYHRTTADDEVKDTVKMLNVYGYTLCWDEAYTVSNLWQAAGLNIRRGIPHGHCTTEVFFDGEFHLLDSDEHLMILRRDNETIAGEADLARDHDLLKRAHAYGITQGESRQTSEGAAALFVHDGPRGGGRPLVAGHRMEMVLRPGEALVWEWTDRGRYHGYNEKPPLIANGRMVFTPRLDESFERWAERAENLHPRDGRLVAVRAGSKSALHYRVASPYVMVGGMIRGDATGDLAVELSWDGETWTRAAAGIGGEFEIGLDEHFPSAMPARYAVHVRLRGAGLSVRRLEIETVLQMAPLALPALEIGGNEIAYTDQSEGEREVRITHAWRERDDVQPPSAPPAPRFPANGAGVPGTQFTFEWAPVDGAADYHFELGAAADLKRALSPTFEKLVSRTPSKGRPEWRVPYEGLLNPDTPYFWRARARGREGLWGPWSEVWSFTPKAPGVPVDVRIEADYDGRTAALHWKPNPSGNAPVRYEVHGSDERGFTASGEDYPAVVDRGGRTETFAANRIASTEDTSFAVIGPDATNRCCYRVVAVDVDGNRSGPSDCAEAPRPFIYSQPPACAAAGETTAYEMKATRSIGELRATSEGSSRYVTAFRGADRLEFILDEGPDFLDLDARTGVLTARPEAKHVGLHTVTLRVLNGNGGTDVQGFDLEVASSQ